MMELLKNGWIDYNVNMRCLLCLQCKGGEMDELSLEDICQLFYDLLCVIPP